MATDERIHRFTTDDYRQMVDAGVFVDARVELLDGIVVDVVSPQSERHVRVIQWLTGCYRGDPRRLRAQASLAAGDGWVPEPDFAISTPVPGPPQWPRTAELVAEVSVSSKARDLRKAAVYAAAGIPVYWLVDVDAAVVLEHTGPGPDGYAVVTQLRGDDVLDAHVDGMAPITVAALLAD